jgi:hypothetical protein
LSILGDAFVALGALFATTVTAGSIPIAAVDGAANFPAGLPFGIIRFLNVLAFCLGLIRTSSAPHRRATT